MKKQGIAKLCLVLAAAGLSAGTIAQAPVPGQTPAAKPRPTVDMTVLHVQVLLDRLGFSPGVLDGKEGQSLTLALRGFQKARGLQPTGKIDQPTLKLLHQYRAVRPTRVVTLSQADVAGPFVGALPKEPEAQAKLPTLGYANAVEKLAESFHTTATTLVALNPPGTRVGVGQKLRVPDVVAASRDYPADLKPEWKATLAQLNVDAQQPKGDHVVVDKSEGVLKVMDANDKVVAQFPATMGSEHDPLPIGTWKIQGASYNPEFHYNAELFWDAKGDKKVLLPPGPNGPVGVIWLDLSKPHYGIHGTPHPETIGRAESHGCIRLTNWDAARLSLMVKLGSKAVFQE